MNFWHIINVGMTFQLVFCHFVNYLDFDIKHAQSWPWGAGGVN